MRLWALVCAVLLLCMAVVFSAQPEQQQGALSSAAIAGVPEDKWILIEINLKRLTLYEGTAVLKTYTIATGTSSTPTPIGTFYITSRFATEMSGFGTRFLSLNVPWGQYGIHGTNKPGSIGSNASHGCIRMQVKAAEELYKLVPNWTKVVIEGGPYGDLDSSLRTLSPGDRGSHVRAVQNKLRALGYYYGSCDGIFGEGTRQAVIKARKDLGLNSGDKVDWAFYQAIGLTLFE